MNANGGTRYDACAVAVITPQGLVVGYSKCPYFRTCVTGDAVTVIAVGVLVVVKCCGRSKGNTGCLVSGINAAAWLLCAFLVNPADQLLSSTSRLCAAMRGRSSTAHLHWRTTASQPPGDSDSIKSQREQAAISGHVTAAVKMALLKPFLFFIQILAVSSPESTPQPDSFVRS
ncbi:hypothetical protein HPB51_000782 [Rhipicephalus microplus]|uniref:Uncharacterized protein n=1 Tax=Rhipicephalus microplus TaxID=6941 RepID=A0A9J6EPV3_RHIMP|nr:hypothetical protein HPB51_000782 [Rhipicephalus microplus]